MGIETLDELRRFNTIGKEEQKNVEDALKRPLSGYLGGVIGPSGYWTERLEAEWCEQFGCKYAIACNSATSGLLAACIAADIKPRDNVWVTPYSMSATAACAIRLGANVSFVDIEEKRYGMDPWKFAGTPPKALIVTNLFGHPAYLANIKRWCRNHNVVMIEDAAQAPFASEGEEYAGTVGDMGVFSLNVHKHMQCGEGGIVVTNYASTAHDLRRAINHGELWPYANQPRVVGLNLRMPQVCAAIACAQLKKGITILDGRIELAEELTRIFSQIEKVKPTKDDEGCVGVYYLWTARIESEIGRDTREDFVNELHRYGFPIRSGYSPPLHALFANAGHALLTFCPVVERVEKSLISFEVCTYDPTPKQIKQMRDIVNRAAEVLR